MKGRQSDDRGFTLVEVIVASAIFLALGTAVAASLLVAIKAAASNEGKVQAANLASRQIELARSVKEPSSLTDTTFTVRRGGLTYTVTQTVDSQTIDLGGSACDGASGAEAVRRISVLVSWPGATASVRSDTYRTLSVTGSSANLGTLTYKVVDRAGQPFQGAPISLLKGGTLKKTSHTGIDGCVVFSNLTPGNDYVGSLTQNGYVDQSQQRTVATANVVTAKRVTKDPGFVWDAAGSIRATVNAPGGYPVPAGIPLTLFSAGLTGGALTLPMTCSTGPCAPANTTATGVEWTATGLFPFASGYQLAPGGCGTACVREQASVPMTPGGTTSVAAPSLGGVSVIARKGSVSGAFVATTMWATNTEKPSEIYQFVSPTGTSATAPAAKLALPAGKWYLSAVAGETNATYRSATIVVSAGSVAAPAVVVVR